MKSFLYPILLSAICTSGIAQTPIVIMEDDLASAGDAYLISNANPIAGIDPNITGADYNWDFSTLEPLNGDTSIWLNEEETNPIYFWLWLSSDIAEQSVSDIVNDYISVEDVFNYYSKNSGEFALTGFAGTIGGIPLPVSFTEQDLIYELPLEYENSFSSTGSFSIDIPGVGSWSESRERTTTVDGWGTVTTPYQTYDVLRTKSVSLVSDIVTYDVVEIPFSYTSTEYKWLAKNSGIPVLQINAQNVLGTETITQIFYRDEELADPVINVEGNNFSVELLNTMVQNELLVQSNLQSGIELNAEIINLNGMLVKSFYSLTAGLNRLSIDDNIPSGFYIINFIVDNQIVSSNKFFK